MQATPVEPLDGSWVAECLRYPGVHLGIQHDAFLGTGLVACADTDRGFLSAVDGNMQHVCRNVNVVAWPHHLAVLQLVSGPCLDFSAEQVESSLMPLMHVGPGSRACRKRYDPEKQDLRADRLRADARFVV